MSNGNQISIDLDNSDILKAKIKVIGVGGGGCNAIQRMLEGNIQGVELIAANTDAQALKNVGAPSKIQLGLKLTKGLGAGSNPEIGRKSAEESETELAEKLSGAEMIFVTCGMGGGTGTGAAPVVARIAQDTGALVVAIVTKPFDFEGSKRNEAAKKGIEEIKKFVDAIIAIPNQKVLEISTKETEMEEAFRLVDDVLFDSTRGISDIINVPGKINVDFADVRTIMKDAGQALIGIGKATGDNRAKEAALKAIKSPLLDDISIEGATGLLVNISYGKSLKVNEPQIIATTIQELTGSNVNLIQGIVNTNNDSDELSVTVIATGFPNLNPGKSENNGIVNKNIFGEETNYLNTKQQPKKNPTNSNSFQPIHPRNFPSQEANSIDPRSYALEKIAKPISIPSGDELKEYETPAIHRIMNQMGSSTDIKTYNELAEVAAYERQDYTEISLTDTRRGIDIMNMSSMTNLQRSFK